MTKLLKIQTLGGVDLAIDSQPMTALRSQKGIALLIYLACTHRPHSREILADLLWDATSTAQSLSNLRTVLARVRHALGDYLRITPTTIALAADAPIALDVEILETEMASLTRHLSSEAAQQVEAVLALYQGDFLAGFELTGAPGFDDWALVERERLRFSVSDALLRLAQDCRQTANYAVGLRVTARLLTLDPLNDDVHAERMRLLAANGQRAAALAHYAACRQLFLAELGDEPGEPLRMLWQAIRDGAEAAPRRAAPEGRAPVRHNLPELPDGTMGRMHTLAAIKTQLRDPSVRLVTLTGEGGVGKSRLALAAGRQMIDDWPDGIWFAPLVGVAAEPALTLPTRLATAVAAALQFSFTGTGKGGEPDPVGQLAGYLRNRELLLILDNFEHLTAGAPFVTELLRHAPRCRVLITSREPLHCRAEAVVSVRGLAAPPADARTVAEVANFASVKLFLARTRRTQATFALTADNAAAIAQLCRLVAGSPLALELAAPWVEHFDVAEMVDILTREGFEFLASTSTDAPQRHRSLHTVFVTSWNLLNASAQRTLAQSAIFRGGFHRQALLAVTDASLGDLQELVSKSLLWQKGPGRYEMHDLLRQFAAAQLEIMERVAGTSPSSAARHSRYYLTLVGAEMNRGAQAKAALEMLQEDIDNIRHAWRRAIASHDGEGLAAGWNGLLDFYLHGMLFTEAEEAFRSAVEMLQAQQTPSAADQQLLATLQVAQAVFLNMLTRYDEARGLAQAAAAVGEAVDDDAIKAWSYLQWGTALFRRGHYDEALDRLRLARQAAAAARLNSVAGDIQRLTGITLLERGEFAEARRQLEQALAVYRQVGNRLGEGNALNDLGWLGQREQNFTDALAYLQAAQRVHREIDNRHGVSIVLINTGIVYEMLGDYGRAYACYQEVQRLLEDLDDRYQRSLLNYSMGVLLARVGDYAAAHTHYLRSLEIDHEIGDRAGMAWTQNSLGLLYNHLGDAKTALAYHREALRSSKEQGALTVQAIAHLGIGQDLYELGRIDAACAAFAAAIAIKDSLGQCQRAVEAKSGMARALVALKRVDEATALVDEVLDFLATNTLQGTRQPSLVYVNCYQVLVANDDPRAPALLREAYLHLQQQASRIGNETWRASFLQHVQANQMLTQTYRTLNPASEVAHTPENQPASHDKHKSR